MAFGAIVDSGATRCLFDISMAEVLGIDVRSGELQHINGIGGVEEVWMHDVILHVPGGAVRVKAGFKEHLPFYGLLGMNGFFEHFTITFDGAAKICVLDRIMRV